MIIAVDTTPPPNQELYFHHKDPQINLWCCLNNNINIKDNNINIKDNNNNKNKINNDSNNKNKNNKNKTTSKQLGCDLIAISLVYE